MHREKAYHFLFFILFIFCKQLFADDVGPFGFATESSNLSIVDQQKDYNYFLQNGFAILSESDIDKMVKSPWSLNFKTAVKISTVYPHMRFSLYQLYTQRPDILEMVKRPKDSHEYRTPENLALDNKAGQVLLKNMLSTISSHFSDDELADLFVYYVSKNMYFPRTIKNWQNLEHTFVASELMLMLTGAVALVASDQGNLATSMWVYNDKYILMRIGWYGSVQKLGLKRHPNLGGGIKAKLYDIEVQAGGTYNMNINTTEISDAEFRLSYSLINEMTKKFEWEMSGNVAGHYPLSNSQSTIYYPNATTFSLYSRKKLSDLPLFLIYDNTVGSDFNKVISMSSSAGIENNNSDFSAVISFSYEKIKYCPVNLKTGIFLAWDIGATEFEKNLLKKLYVAGFDL